MNAWTRHSAKFATVTGFVSISPSRGVVVASIANVSVGTTRAVSIPLNITRSRVCRARSFADAADKLTKVVAGTAGIAAAVELADVEAARAG